MVRFIAYVDPGTGSFALQAAVGAVMGVSFMLRTHVKNFVNRFRKGSRTQKPDDAR
jgi:hypothetical protein